MKFFDDCQDLSQAKERFHMLAKLFHPDRGGEIKLMQILNSQYEEITLKFQDIQEIYSPKKLIFEFEVKGIKIQLEDFFKGMEKWSKSNKKFDPSFVESIHEYFRENGGITEAQADALIRIVKSWFVDLDKYMKNKGKK